MPPKYPKYYVPIAYAPADNTAVAMPEVIIPKPVSHHTATATAASASKPASGNNNGVKSYPSLPPPVSKDSFYVPGAYVPAQMDNTSTANTRTVPRIPNTVSYMELKKQQKEAAQRRPYPALSAYQTQVPLTEQPLSAEAVTALSYPKNTSFMYHGPTLYDTMRSYMTRNNLGALIKAASYLPPEPYGDILAGFGDMLRTGSYLKGGVRVGTGILESAAALSGNPTYHLLGSILAGLGEGYVENDWRMGYGKMLESMSKHPFVPLWMSEPLRRSGAVLRTNADIENNKYIGGRDTSDSNFVTSILKRNPYYIHSDDKTTQYFGTAAAALLGRNAARYNKSATKLLEITPEEQKKDTLPHKKSSNLTPALQHLPFTPYR